MEDYQLYQQKQQVEEIPFLPPFPPLPHPQFKLQPLPQSQPVKLSQSQQLPLPVPLPLELEKEKRKRQMKFTLSEVGDLNFQGEIDENVYLLIEQAIAASQTKTKMEHQLKMKEIDSSKNIDSVVIVFASAMLSLTVFFTYTIVSMMSGYFHRHANTEAIIKVS